MSSLHEERNRTHKNIKNDQRKIEKALMGIKDLSVEGEILREDLLGLLFYENPDHLDSLRIWKKRWDNAVKQKIK